MRIGYACIPLGVDYTTNRGFLIKNYSEERLIEKISQNLDDLLRILEYNHKNKIYLFRISSEIIPFGSHEINDFPWEIEFKEKLIEIGCFIKKNGMRVSMHPGQYTILNSHDAAVVNRAVRDIEYHTKFLDSLNVDYSNKIVIHIGGVYGDKEESMKRFQDNFNLLSQSAKKRLVIENDERSYNVEDVLRIAKKIEIPVVLDVFHDELNPSTIDDYSILLNEIEYTYGNEDGPMKIHYSNQSINKKFGAHSEWVFIDKFIEFYEKFLYIDCDIILEVKDKDISAIKCINSIFEPSIDEKNGVWEKYKYLIMEKSQDIYEKCNEIINNEGSILAFYKEVDRGLLLSPSDNSYKSTLLEVWGYLAERVSPNEEMKFFEFLNQRDYLKAKKHIYRLSNKYKIDCLIDSYYFLNLKTYS